MALVAALTEIVLLSFEPTTGIYNAVTLNDTHRDKIFKGWVKKLEKAASTTYHNYFLTETRTEISRVGLYVLISSFLN